MGGDLPRRAGFGRLLPDRRAAAGLQAVATRCRRRTCSKGCARCCSRAFSAWDHFRAAAALNVVYLALGAAAFAWPMRDARNRGTLLQMGE